MFELEKYQKEGLLFADLNEWRIYTKWQVTITICWNLFGGMLTRQMWLLDKTKAFPIPVWRSPHNFIQKGRMNWPSRNGITLLRFRLLLIVQRPELHLQVKRLLSLWRPSITSVRDAQSVNGSNSTTKPFALFAHVQKWYFTEYINWVPWKSNLLPPIGKLSKPFEW